MQGLRLTGVFSLVIGLVGVGGIGLVRVTTQTPTQKSPRVRCRQEGAVADRTGSGDGATGPLAVAARATGGDCGVSGWAIQFSKSGAEDYNYFSSVEPGAGEEIFTQPTFQPPRGDRKPDPDSVVVFGVPIIYKVPSRLKSHRIRPYAP